jgi:hypothetical protein
MFTTLGQVPSKTSGLVPLDLSSFAVAWRGRLWHFAGAEDSPPAGEPPAPPPAPVTPPAADPPTTFDAAYVAELRKEAAANRKRAADAEARLKTIDEAALSETERLTKRATELEAQLATEQIARREERIRSAVLVSASSLSYADPEDAYPLLLARGDRVEINEQGEPTNVKKLLEDLLKAKPHLAKVAAGTAPINGPPRQNAAAQTREQLANEKYEKLKASGSYSRL